MIIPVLGNIIIKPLPVLDAEGGEMDAGIATHRRGEIIALGNEVTIPVKVGDIVLMNRGNFFLILSEDEMLVHCSAVFAIDKPE